MPNRLIHETSPYLLQHAHNPVDWYPWGPEAFEKARAEDRPLLVSIGYAACHWCHVMERESFEDEATAALMNANFVSIKVDREERPDVDAIYMQALQSLRGQGGWPLNMFLMPDGRPFFGGTYFPNTDGRGVASWTKVLEAVADAYKNRRDSVLQNARVLTESLQVAAQAEAADEPLRSELSDDAFRDLVHAFDEANGGFGQAPKFPQSMPQEFLLRYHARTGDAHARHMVETSLRKMALGGIYDHVGGGFARYSTDDRWLVPHFEKMLYDNALLATAYLQAYQLTGEPLFRSVTRETLDYLLRDLRHADGAFFSSQDADSEGVEGKYYVWTPEEIDATLGEQDGALLRSAYDVTPAGNFEGANILHLAQPLTPEARDALAPARGKLLEKRATRVAPATDDKVLTAWNGLAIRALAEAGAVLDEPGYRDAAARAAGFLLAVMLPDGRLLRTWKDGHAHLLGYLEDYACLINGLVSVHETTFAHSWLHAARDLADEMIALFWDNDAEVIYDVGTDHEQLIVRPRDSYDNAVPAGASAAAEALQRLAVITGSEEYARIAARLLRGMVPHLHRSALAFGNWFKVLELYFADPSEVAIVGDRAGSDTRALLDALYARYEPNRTLVGWQPAEPTPFASPILEDRGQIDGRATAYVCHGYACDLPTTEPAVLAQQLAAPSPAA
jgi:uncharacterized protein YyaL (SSP411 family)